MDGSPANKNEMREKDQEISALRNTLDRLQQENAQLRAVVLKNAGTEKFSDREITSKFISIRRRIESIARLPVFQMDEKAVLPRNTTNREWLVFFSESFWGRLTRGERANRLIGKIFEFIYLRILDCRLFGTEGLGLSDGKLKKTMATPGLRCFEETLETGGVPDNMISSWRLLTMDCVERLGPQTPVLAIAVSEDIYKFLGPLMDPIQSPQDADELHAKLMELCSEAVNLRMIMRRSRDRYTCEYPGVAGWSHIASQCKELVEAMAVEGGRASQASDRIAYTLFGGLVKRSAEYGGGEKKVLENAWVVLKAMD
ncbi:hypothetical protein V8F20_012779 [Naviculisporaceae sp. PSN 640]